VGPLRERIAAAWRARAGLGDCHRLLHGWGEGVPGIEIDRHGDCAAIEHAPDQAALLGEVVSALDACHRFETIAARPRGFGAEPVALRGSLGRRIVSEEGIRYQIDLARAGNPGLYLDARPARAWIRAHSANRRVLNLFAFSGSLGVAAAVGGARSVTHVDSHPGALEWCRVNSELNGIAVDGRDLARMNIYQHLRRAQAGRQRYDAILLDPPPGPSEPRPKDRTPGLRGVAALAPLCARMLSPGGWLLCLIHRDRRPRDEIEGEIAQGAGLEVLWRGGAGPEVPEPDPTRALRVTAFAKIA
jgi:23S rRNA (cytosine1962-C5)-methyltransferase